MVHTESQVVPNLSPNFKGRGNCWMGHLAGPLQFIKTLAVLIALCSRVDGIAGHHTLQVNVKNVLKARTLHSKGAHLNSRSITLW
jgi:hypothetical protein